MMLFPFIFGSLLNKTTKDTYPRPLLMTLKLNKTHINGLVVFNLYNNKITEWIFTSCIMEEINPLKSLVVD